MKLVFLWTDILFWLLIAMTLFIIFTPKPRHIKQAWSHVWQSKLAMSTVVIVMFYIAITLLDSLHFRPHNGDVKSLLDLILSPLDQILVTSYSSPFQDANPQDVIQKTLVGLIIGFALSFMICVILKYAHIKIPQQKTFFITLMCVITLFTMLFYLSRDYHVFGTDKIGQDVFYQTMKSIRTGVLIGTLTTMVLLPFAMIFGMFSGYFKGWIDDIIQYIYTVLSSIPNVLLIVASVLVLDLIIERTPSIVNDIAMRADIRLLALCVILGVTSWTSLCRLLRAETLKLKEQDYVQAGIALGTSHWTIIAKHITPNLMHIVFITIALDFSSLVLAEAILAYIGVGVDPTTFSGGNMINVARLELAREPVVWWSLTAAFVFMFILVLAANLLADVIQKAFDPRARRLEQ